MTIFNDYSKSGKLLESRDEPVTIKNIDRYIAEYSEDRALGYLEAANDFKKQLNEFVYRRSHATAKTHKLRDFILNVLNDFSAKKIGSKNEPDAP